MGETPITPEEYFLLTDLVKKLAQNQQLAEDLVQEVTVYFIELAEDKKRVLREKGLVQAWFIKTILNQDRSKTSYFYRKFKTDPRLDSKEISEIIEDEYDEEELDEQIMLVGQWVNDLFLSDQNIIRDYYYKGLTIMAISAKYDCDKNYVVSVLTRVKESFYRKIIWRRIPKRVVEITLQEYLAPMLGRKRLKAVERQLIIDGHNFLFNTNYNAWFDRELCTFLLQSLIQKLKI